MESTPVAIALHLCDYVIIEERTQKVTLVGTFSRLAIPELPGVAAPFFVTAVLTDGLGEGIISLEVTLLETGEEVYLLERRISFPEMLQEVHYFTHVSRCRFPREGLYQFTLLVDGEWVAHRRVYVFQNEESS